MHTIKNTAGAMRGFHAEEGFVQLANGQEWTGDISEGELKSAKATGYFEIAKAKAGAKATQVDASDAAPQPASGDAAAED